MGCLSCPLMLLFLCQFSSGNYIFAGCEIQDKIEIETEKDSVNFLVSTRSSSSSVQINVKQNEEDVASIPVSIPEKEWTNIQIILQDKISVFFGDESSADGKILSPVDFSSPKTVEVTATGGTVKDCPQGLPFKRISNPQHYYYYFPSAGDKTEEEYVLYPLIQTRVRLNFCNNDRTHCQGFLCYDDTKDQLTMEKDEDECNPLPSYTYQRFHLHFENSRVNVMNQSKDVLCNLKTEEGFRVGFKAASSKGEIIVIQCLKNDCKQPLGFNTSTTTVQGTTTEQPTKETWLWLVPTVIAVLLGFACIGDCLYRRHQVNKLRAECDRLKNAVPSNNTHPPASNSNENKPVCVETINDIYVPFDELH